MAHDISRTADGIDEAMFAAVPAWHGLGTVVRDAPTSEEALHAAHLDWEVGKRPLFEDAKGTGSFEEVPSHVRTFRKDSGAPLGVVGADYGIVQNREAFALLDNLARDGVVRYESAFAMNGGRKVCLLARLRDTVTVGDRDQVDLYCLFQTSHDGSSALHILPTNVRVVCANTWRMALEEGESRRKLREGTFFTLRHTSNVKANAEAAVDLIADLSGAFARQGSQARALRDLKLSEEDFAAYLDAVMPLPEPKKRTGQTNPAFAAAIETRQVVHARWLKSPHNRLPGMERSAWAAFNAVTEHVDHSGDAGRESDGYTKDESAFRVKVLGNGSVLKANAWDAAVALVEAAG